MNQHKNIHEMTLPEILDVIENRTSIKNHEELKAVYDKEKSMKILTLIGKALKIRRQLLNSRIHF